MNDWSDVTRLPDDFDGRVRLFPLPDLVLFPHAMQPLHIFEPRYCEMLQESLAGDQLIAMATLGSGPEVLPAIAAGEASPPIESTVCIGRVVSHNELEDDRHNILLVGTQRAKILREVDAGRTFRIAEVKVLLDVYPPKGAKTRQDLKKRLLDAFAGIIPPTANVQQNLHELMAGQMGLGPITDIVSHTLPFDTADKLHLLGIADVDDRARQLVDLLQSGKIELHSVSSEEQTFDPETGDLKSKDGGDRFPPPFSLN